MNGTGLAADLSTLLLRSSPSPPDVSCVSSDGIVVGEAHRGLVWARVPALRQQLREQHERAAACSGDQTTIIELPEGIGHVSVRLVLHWIYRGELQRRMDDEPLAVATMRELRALAQAWELPALALQGHKAPPGVVPHSGGRLGVARPHMQSLCDDLCTAFDGDDSTFFDIVVELCTPGSELPQPEPQVEPTDGAAAGSGDTADASTVQLDPVVCRGNRAVLSCRSGFFRAMLNGGRWLETRGDTGVVQLRLPFHSDNFLVVNRFLHTGIISIETVEELRFAIQLADYFDIAALHERCGDWIIESLAVETVCSLWNVVESSPLGRLADSLYGAGDRDSGAAEREDLLGNPSQLCCDFCTTYLSAIVQHESFLALQPELLARVLSSGLASVPTDRLVESVHQWVDARLQAEFDGDALRVEEEVEGTACDTKNSTDRVATEQQSDRNMRKHELLSSLLPPATMFNRTVREMLLGVGRLAEVGPRSLV